MEWTLSSCQRGKEKRPTTRGESDKENAEGTESENPTLIVRKFKQKKNFKKNDSTSYNFTCFEYGKSSRIKSESSIFLKKQQEGEKKEKCYN